jgi:hypothetical protein
MEVKVVWNVHDWAQAVVELPVGGALPCRTVLGYTVPPPPPNLKQLLLPRLLRFP